MKDAKGIISIERQTIVFSAVKKAFLKASFVKID
jgi:hypothetical protein